MTTSSSKPCNCDMDMEERVKKEHPVECNSFIMQYNTPLSYILLIVCMCTHKREIPQHTGGHQRATYKSHLFFHYVVLMNRTQVTGLSSKYLNQPSRLSGLLAGFRIPFITFVGLLHHSLLCENKDYVAMPLFFSVVSPVALLSD